MAEMEYQAYTEKLAKHIGELGRGVPDTLRGFYAMAHAAKKDGALDVKTKELICLAIGVATRCKGCIGFHAKALVELGASAQEVMECLGVAVYMGGGPSLMYAAEAMQAFSEFAEARG